MQSVILITEKGYGIQRLTNLIAPLDCTIEEQSPTTVLIRNTSSHAWIRLDDKVMFDYESDELEEILAAVPDPEFYVLESSDLLFIKGMLQGLGKNKGILVDNDHGDILTGSEFTQRLQDDPNWDWRNS